MLKGLPILIVEDEPLVALELAMAIEALDGRTVGPVATITQAMILLETETIAAAILDANLLDGEVTPLAIALEQNEVPFIIHTGTGVPADLAEKMPNLPVVMKPADSTSVLAVLLQRVSADRSKFR